MGSTFVTTCCIVLLEHWYFLLLEHGFSKTFRRNTRRSAHHTMSIKRSASTPAFDCNMGCHLAGDHLVGRFSGNLLDATLGGVDIIVDLVKTDCVRL